jgi:hypothetical protein
MITVFRLRLGVYYDVKNRFLSGERIRLSVRYKQVKRMSDFCDIRYRSSLRNLSSQHAQGDILILEDGTDTLSRNAGNTSTYAAEQPRRAKTLVCVYLIATNVNTKVLRILFFVYLECILNLLKPSGNFTYHQV